jgi:hypothetical protein
MAICSPRFIVARFQLFFHSCCVAAIAVLIRWGVGPFSFVEPTVLTIFVAASIFVLSILMSGVMQDFKDAERIPGDVASAFAAMLSQVIAFSRNKKKKTPRAETLEALRALAAWLLATARLIDCADNDAATAEAAAAACHEAQTALTAETIMSGSWNTSFANWLMIVSARLSRMRVIRDTDFYLPAYTLFDSLSAVVFALLFVTKHASDVTGFIITSVLAFLFFYLANFVRALDNPFVYAGNVHVRKVESAFGASAALRALLASEQEALPAPKGVQTAADFVSVCPPAVPASDAGSLARTAIISFVEATCTGSQRLNAVDWDELFERFTVCLVEAVNAVDAAAE